MEKIYYIEYNFYKIGRLIIASHKDKLVFIDIIEDKLNKFAEKLNLKPVKDMSPNKLAINQLEEYLAGKRTSFDIPREFLVGTDFQVKVWNELAEIPYGKTISYKELAVNTGNPNAQRAVGSANSKNPLPIIYPCHRVINSNGALGGYSCSLCVKKILLEIETM